jgi:hypothetical protein
MTFIIRSNICFVHGKRLFAQHMLPVLSCLQDVGEMKWCRRADDNRINVRFPECILGRKSMRNPEPALHFQSPVPVDVVDGVQ